MLDLRLFCIYNMHDNEKAIQREVISMAKQIKKVVLAYSGGLDTSIIIPWLKENYDGCEVIAVSGDVGQGTELDGLEEKAKKTGASKLYVLDLKKDFVENYIFPTMQAGAVYEDKYLLGTSFARPVIAKAIVDIAKKEGADAICHGCTGKGNDQVRFELTIKAFAPEMTIIAPWRIWNIKSREEEIEYAEAHNIPLKINRETNYSKDKNLWHLSHEGSISKILRTSRSTKKRAFWSSASLLAGARSAHLHHPPLRKGHPHGAQRRGDRLRFPHRSAQQDRR